MDARRCCRAPRGWPGCRWTDSRQPLRARPADRRAGARGTGAGRAGRHRPWLTPDDDPREVLGFLDERSERNLLLVSHQPLVGALGGLLVHGNRRDPLPMSTASLAELEGDFAAAGLMTLVSLHHPRHGWKRLAQRLQTETFPGLPAVGCDGIFDQASAWSISQNNNNGGGTWSLQIVCRSKSSSSASVIRNGVTWCSPSVAAGSRS